ncbi:MAG TPA: hypothetical protein VF883_08460 [Thermoanaerobaculia bacterium]|jgi:hypothetical protein
MRSKIVTAEYLADNNMLRLTEPLADVQDHAMVTVIVSQSVERPWLKLSGCLSPEDGAEMAALIEEMFPT